MEYIGHNRVYILTPNTPKPVAIILPPPPPYPKTSSMHLAPTPPYPKCLFLEIPYFWENGFCKNHHIFACIGQSATTKVTVWTMGSYQDFGEKPHLEGKLF